MEEYQRRLEEKRRYRGKKERGKSSLFDMTTSFFKLSFPERTLYQVLFVSMSHPSVGPHTRATQRADQARHVESNPEREIMSFICHIAYYNIASRVLTESLVCLYCQSGVSPERLSDLISDRFRQTNHFLICTYTLKVLKSREEEEVTLFSCMVQY